MKNTESKNGLGQGIRYILVGITTTLINIGIYHGLLLLGVDYKISNVFAVVLCKIYGYAANKLIVFQSHCRNSRELLAEIGKYVLARGFSGLVDYFGLILAVEVLGLDEVISKYIIQAIVIIMNYVLGKFIVFRRKDAGI